MYCVRVIKVLNIFPVHSPSRFKKHQKAAVLKLNLALVSITFSVCARRYKSLCGNKHCEELVVFT